MNFHYLKNLIKTGAILTNKLGNISQTRADLIFEYITSDSMINSTLKNVFNNINEKNNLYNHIKIFLLKNTNIDSIVKQIPSNNQGDTTLKNYISSLNSQDQCDLFNMFVLIEILP